MKIEDADLKVVEAAVKFRTHTQLCEECTDDVCCPIGARLLNEFKVAHKSQAATAAN